jgi:hypothetical protein
MENNIIRKYCMVGLGNVSGVTKLLSEISEEDVAYVSGSGLVIATFISAFSLTEVEQILKDDEKSYIVFEMTPGFYSADIKDEKFQNTLFGGPMDNSKLFQNIDKNTSSIMEIIKGKIVDGDYEVLGDEPDPDMDDILDRISEVGYEKLSTKEKKLLKKYSEEKNN